MDALIPFLKHSNVLDLLVIMLVMFLTVILIPVGIWIVIASQRRKPIYLFLVIALLPLLLALLGTYQRFRNNEKAIAMFSEASAEVVAEARREGWITSYLGLAGTGIIELIGVVGLILKKTTA